MGCELLKDLFGMKTWQKVVAGLIVAVILGIAGLGWKWLSGEEEPLPIPSPPRGSDGIQTVRVTGGGRIGFRSRHYGSLPDGLNDTLRSHYLDAQRYYGKGNLDGAVRELSLCLEQVNNPRYRALLNLQIGNCYYMKGVYFNAAHHYEAGLARAEEVQNLEIAACLSLNLVHAYMVKPADPTERETNLQEALRHSKRALEIFVTSAYPRERIVTLNGLAGVYEEMPAASPEERSEHMTNACSCYREALQLCDRDKFSVEYAMTLNNYANARLSRSAARQRRRTEIETAIRDYQEALVVFTEQRHRSDYALVQVNMGSAIRELPCVDAEEKSRNLSKAKSCYENALRVYTEEAHPYEYAAAVNNLGNVFTEMSEQNADAKSENVSQAIKYYEAALAIFTKDKYPTDYAMVHVNLAAAYNKAAEAMRLNTAWLVKEAMGSAREAMDLYSEAGIPLAHAIAQANLGDAWRQLPAATKRDYEYNISEAVACYEAAIQKCTMEADAQHYSQMAEGMGYALALAGSAEASSWLGRAYDMREYLPDQGQAAYDLLTRIENEAQKQ